MAGDERSDAGDAARDDAGTGPHLDQPVATAGAPAAAADAAAVLLHGRGGTAEGVVRVAESFARHGVTLVAPQAAKSRWFPHAVGEPVERNEPHLSSALRAVEDALDASREAGVPAERTLLFGVSQGACLASEFAVRRPQRYGGVAVVSGGLLGPTGTARDADGDLAGTPVYVHASEDDPRVPVERVRETARVFESLGGDVSLRVDPGEGHGLSEDGSRAVGAMLDDLLAGSE